MPGVTGNGTLIIPTGATTTDVAEGSNLYFTNVRARTAVELTVNAIANVNYTLVSTDSNTIVYASNANVIVPHNSSVAFRNGQEIIVSTGSSPVIIDRANTQTSIYLSGNTQAGVWIIPPRTRASLLKLESEVWYLDGKDIVRF